MNSDETPISHSSSCVS